MEFFHCEKVAANVTKISDVAGVHAYLVEGRQKAALLDTCSGAGNLKAFVGSLTRQPVVVICTHGHVDHAGGTFGFDPVYLNERDLELAKRHTSVEFRRGFVETAVPPGVITSADYVPQREGEYLNLVDGQVFDLGGLSLEAIALPGHTQGMTCILVRELRALLLGDGCNSRTFLFSPEASSVEQYQVQLRNLLRHETQYDTVWFSHGHHQGSKTIVPECIELCAEIMAGQTDNVPFQFMGDTACLAKTINPDYSRVDGKTANIVFDPTRIFVK
jgi:hydroxyacylglutathione hydrolase